MRGGAARFRHDGASAPRRTSSAAWGGPGSNKDQFIWPYGLEAGKDGFVYVSDAGAQRIQKFDAGGHFVASFWLAGSW